MQSPRTEEAQKAPVTSTLDQILQNLWAGLGLTTVLFVLFFANNRPDPISVPGLWGLALFGILCIVRFSRDEVHLLASGLVLAVAMQAARLRINKLQQEVERLRIENNLLRGKLARNTLGVDHHLEEEVENHEHYAMILFNRLSNALPISRGEVDRLRLMSRSNWKRGRDFLIAAGVMDQANRPLVGSQENGLDLIREYANKLRKEAR